MSKTNEAEQCRLYGDLAWLWPLISPPADYLAAADEAATLLRRFGRREIRRVLDLGCGGGHFDYGLKRHFAIVGVDLSEAMLALAHELNPEVTYLRGDLRAPPTRELFDAVYLGDAVNYMLSEADLRRAFRAAYEHLAPGGGFFTFAERTRENLTSPETHVTHHADEHVHVTFIEDMYDPDAADSTYDVTLLFLIRRGRELAVEVDRHRCGLFPLTTWQATAAEVGFDTRVIAIEDAPAIGIIGVKPLSPG
ncbi:MAG: class I SAM-dependent DNA methyltransferase [Planctomycetota bacterium]|jgi:SAM-dependent methyltransferase